MIALEEGNAVPTVPSAEEEFFAQTEEDPLDVLTDRQRFVLELRYGLRDGVSYSQREVAALMGVGRSTVWKHEKAAKKRLGRAAKRGRETQRVEDFS